MSEALGKSIHESVMPEEVADLLRVKSEGTFLDCTLGGGGHTKLMLEGHPKNSVLAIDRDARAIGRARERFVSFGQRLELKQGSFGDVTEIVGKGRFRGMLADLGLSTDQLKEGRGFSFADSGALDMRMDSEQALSAQEVVNEFSDRELTLVLQRGGVGKEARRLAQAIVRARPISSPRALAEIIEAATPRRLIKPGFHPATVPFQAIRIEVNQEFSQIEALLEQAPNLLENKGRLAVITFHSGEDRLVTHTMRRWEQGEKTPALWRGAKPSGQRLPPNADRRSRVQAGESVGALITKKPVLPSAAEISRNPSSRSSRLRVFEFD